MNVIRLVQRLKVQTVQNVCGIQGGCRVYAAVRFDIIKWVQKYLMFFVFLGILFCFCAFAWSEGTGGREGWTEGGRGVDSRETLIPSHF